MIAPFARAESAPVDSKFRLDGHPGADGDGQDGLPGTDGAPGAPGARGPSHPAQRPPQPAVNGTGDVSRLLSLLADKTRLKILRLLAGGERPVVSLTSELGLPQPTVSHHLAWLRMMDLVSPRRQGKHVYYSLGPAVREDGNGTMTLSANDASVTIAPRSR